MTFQFTILEGSEMSHQKKTSDLITQILGCDEVSFGEQFVIKCPLASSS
jgi:hypothetical protein